MDDLDNPLAKSSRLQVTVTPSAQGSAASRAAQRAQEAAKRKAAAQQRLLFILLGIALVLNLGFGYFLYGLMVVDVSQRNEQELISWQLDIAAKKIASYTAENQEKLDKLAGDTALLQAFTEKNRVGLDTIRNSFIPEFDQALDIKAFIVGEADVNREGAVPIRFAELDLIRRAEQRQKAYPEAAQINDSWQIHFVSSVAAGKDQPVVGTLLLALNAEPVKKILQTLDSGVGELIFQQKFPNSAAQNILKVGTAGSHPGQERALSESNWQVKFTPSEQAIENAQESPTFWILASGCATAFSLFLALVLSRLLAKSERTAEKQMAPTAAEANTAASDAVVETTPGTLYQTQDILDIAVIGEDENILGLKETAKKKPVTGREQISDDKVPLHIFRSYDIRGIVGKDLNEEFAELIGRAAGSEALDQGENSLIVARDGRTHSAKMTAALIRGILSTGCNVVNIGIVPTPVMYFATYHFDDVRSGVMVTASHNPAEYNGFKIVINNNALADEAVLELRDRIIKQRLHQGLGEESFREIIPHYIERIFSDVALAGDVSLVIDAGNAVPGVVAPQLFEELGCEVTPLYCDLDGDFPNHEPDPTQESNLFALIEKVKEVNADIGVAFDGDGDRLVVVTPKGDIIWPDRLLMLFAKDILARNPGADVLFDVKCSRLLNQVISGYGGRPIMWKTGHSPMKAKMVETGALIGGEYSGHIFIKDRWYGFDDGIYAMARLLEIITLRDQNIDDIFAAFPQLVITPEIKIPVPDNVKFDVIRKLAEQGDFQNANITRIDGVRVDYSKGWGLVRASNTSPALTLRFEAENQEALGIIQQIFKRELLKIDSSLAIKF